jgi:hypothetical protein
LGRIIHTTNPTRQRTALLKRIASSIRRQSGPDGAGTDILELASALLADLREIRESVNRTAEAWEKRDYWVKADAFRRQWNWLERIHNGLTEALQSGDRPALQARISELGRMAESPPAAQAARR